MPKLNGVELLERIREQIAARIAAAEAEQNVELAERWRRGLAEVEEAACLEA